MRPSGAPPPAIADRQKPEPTAWRRHQGAAAEAATGGDITDSDEEMDILDFGSDDEEPILADNLVSEAFDLDSTDDDDGDNENGDDDDGAGVALLPAPAVLVVSDSSASDEEVLLVAPSDDDNDGFRIQLDSDSDGATDNDAIAAVADDAEVMLTFGVGPPAAAPEVPSCFTQSVATLKQAMVADQRREGPEAIRLYVTGLQLLDEAAGFPGVKPAVAAEIEQKRVQASRRLQMLRVAESAADELDQGQVVDLREEPDLPNTQPVTPASPPRLFVDGADDTVVAAMAGHTKAAGEASQQAQQVAAEGMLSAWRGPVADQQADAAIAEEVVAETDFESGRGKILEHEQAGGVGASTAR